MLYVNFTYFKDLSYPISAICIYSPIIPFSLSTLFNMLLDFISSNIVLFYGVYFFYYYFLLVLVYVSFFYLAMEDYIIDVVTIIYLAIFW